MSPEVMFLYYDAVVGVFLSVAGIVWGLVANESICRYNLEVGAEHRRSSIIPLIVILASMYAIGMHGSTWVATIISPEGAFNVLG